MLAQRFDSLPLQTKLILTFLLIVLIPLAILVFLNNWRTQAVLTEAANQRLLAAASETAAAVDLFITTNRSLIEAEAQLPEIVAFLNTPVEQRPGGNYLRDTLRALGSKDEHIVTYGLLDSEGRNVSDSVQMLLNQDESDNDYFQIPMRTNESYVSPVLIDEAGQTALFFSTPVYNALGEVNGVLRVRYAAAVLEDLVDFRERLAEEELQASVFVILLDENFVRLVDIAQPELTFKSVTPLDPALISDLQAAGRLPDLPLAELSTNLRDFERGLSKAKEVASGQLNFTGTAHPGSELEQGAVVRLQTQPWFMVFIQARSVFLKPIEEQTRIILIFAFLIGIAAAIFAIFVSRRLARPIISLTAGAQRVAEGDLSAQVPVIAQDETGQLAAAFNSMTTQLRSLVGSLEERIHERTGELALSMEVGQRASTIRDLDELLPTITTFIQERFDFYNVQVYLIDDTGKNLVLRTGTGTIGQHLLNRRHSLLIEGDSVVCWAARQGEAIVVPDVEELGIQPIDPLFQATRSELALPLMIEGRVIGVLDLQSREPDTFNPNNLIVFEAMVTQLAISIDSAQQWTLAQEAQQRLEAVIQQLTRKAWINKLSKYATNLGFSYDLASITSLDSETQNGEISIPLVIQNETIGQLSVKTLEGKTLSQDEQDLLAAVAQQLAQKAENIRLFEETQRQAAREQLARQITERIRASHDIETALKTAAEELNKALGTARAVIDLNVASDVDQRDDTSSLGSTTRGPRERFNE